jgi:hypothetical protein
VRVGERLEPRSVRVGGRLAGWEEAERLRIIRIGLIWGWHGLKKNSESSLDEFRIEHLHPTPRRRVERFRALLLVLLHLHQPPFLSFLVRTMSGVR